MNLGKTIYVTNRRQWRSWLAKNHKTAKEIWLVYYKKQSLKPRIPYNNAVEEALCFGWIDSTVKTIDEDRFAQRFTPRRNNSLFSEMNKERIRRLIRQKKMTPAGLDTLKHTINSIKNAKFTISSDILKALKKNKNTWKYFEKFPLSYRRIRIGWIESARSRPHIFQQRLKYFLKMTARNKMFGMVR